MYGLDLARKTKYDVVCLAGAYLAVFLSLVASVLLRESHWFSRAGSVMVLLGVIVEYRNFGLQQIIYERATEGAGALGGGVDPLAQPRGRQILSKFTHFTIILGTLIWGYGDLFLEFKT